MSTRLSYLLMSIIVFGMAAATYGVQLGNFENNMDGWVVYDDPNSPSDPNVSVSFSDMNGVTSGQYSLRMTANSGNQRAIGCDLMGSSKVEEFRKNLKISVDITRLSSNWTDLGSSWCSAPIAINAGFSDGTTLWEQLDEPANWDPGFGDDPITFIYDYSTVLNQIDFNNLSSLEVFILTNWGNYDPGGVYYIDNVQILGGGPAYDPEPADKLKGVPTDTILSWTAGAYAKKHDVYFGTNFNDVNSASRTSDPNKVLVSMDQDATTYDPPDILKAGQPYFWRIDEVNDSHPDKLWRGDVWTFTAAYPFKGYVFGDWEDSMDGWTKWTSGKKWFSLSYSTTGATLNNKSLKASVYPGKSVYWIAQLALTPAQLEILKANDLLSLDVTWVQSDWRGSGGWAKINAIAINSAATGWKEVAVPIADTSNPTAPGEWYSTTFGDVDTRTVTYDYSSIDVASIDPNGWCQLQFAMNCDSAFEPNVVYYFDKLRLYSSRTASEPNPTDGDKDIRTDPTLSWKPGRYAVTHEVYLGTRFSDVSNVTKDNLGSYPNVIFADDVDVNSYSPAATLQFNTTYYWRVDEVNDAHADKLWKGDVWRFTTGNFYVIDDFEDYNNSSPQMAFQTWRDGFGYSADPKYSIIGYCGNDTGSTVGYDIWSEDGAYYLGNIMETSNVHGGLKAMPVDYNSLGTTKDICGGTNPLRYSEAERIFSPLQNWSGLGVKTLKLWFRGLHDSVGSLKYDQVTGTYTMTGSGADIWGTRDEFHFAYKQMSGDGAIIAKIESINGGGGWAKVGVMIRKNLMANSPLADVVITPTGRVALQWRMDRNVDMADPDSSTSTDENAVTLSHWVKLTREGDTFTAQHSSNGVAWEDISSGIEGEFSYVTISPSMGTDVLVGLAVSANNAAATCEANISHVTINGSAAGITKSQDIGIVSNDAEPLFVTAEDAGSPSRSKTVTHSDPNAVQNTDWQEWSIPLKTFSDAGVDLKNIKKIILGVGNKTNPPSSGTGRVYFDDIRLYRCSDLTGDCVIDLRDLEVMAEQWLLTEPPVRTADLNKDGTVDYKDYAALAAQWLEEVL